MTDLKPCPFCGHSPYLVHSEVRTQSRKRPWQIECCDLTVGPNRSREDCEDWWNTRHVNYFANLGKALWLVGLMLAYGTERYLEGYDNGDTRLDLFNVKAGLSISRLEVARCMGWSDDD